MPLVSTDALTKTARAEGLHVISIADSSKPVTEYTLGSPTAGTHRVHAQTEDGYTVFRGIPSGPGRVSLSPNGMFCLLNDSGAQCNLIGKMYKGYLTEFEITPPRLRIVGAGNHELAVHCIGHLYVEFSSAPFAGAPWKHVGTVGARRRFMVGMVSESLRDLVLPTSVRHRGRGS